MIKAVIFDLDGVITDTAEFHFLAWRNMAQKIGIDFDREFNENLKGISRMESLDLILKHGGKTDLTEEERVTLAQSKNEEYVELLVNLKPEDIYPGIGEFLESLKKENIRIALASASKNAIMILDALGIRSDFEVIVDPGSVAKGKPAPDIFLEAARLLGVEASACVGVEDSIAGINSIKDAGMFAVGVGTVDAMRAAGADIVLENTAQLTLDVVKEGFAAQIA